MSGTRRGWSLGAAVLLILVSLLVPGAGGVPAVQSASPAKKVCKTVTRTVHGKRRRVKVCHTVTPTPRATSTPLPPVTSTPVVPSVAAGTLADALSSATSEDARAAALLTVMRTIHLGVYDATSGTPLSPGLDTNSHDLYLFSGELRLLAGSLGRGERSSMTDLAARLSAGGIMPGGKPVTGVAMQGLVQGIMHWALDHPSDPLALLPLLVRDLGLQHAPPTDLAKPQTADAAILDEAQATLLQIYLLYPIAHSGSRRTAGLRPLVVPHAGGCAILKYTVSTFNPNSYLGSDAEAPVLVDMYVASAASDLVAAIGRQLAIARTGAVLDALSAASLVVAGVHGVFVAGGLQLDSGPPLRDNTHDGPAGHDVDAGKPIVFTATLTMHNPLSAGEAACLGDIGLEIPKDGPVPGVEIAWQNIDLLATDIDAYGTVVYQPADRKTDANGVSQAIFTPKTEVLPGLGIRVTATGGYEPRALWGFAFHNVLGTVTQLLLPKLGPLIDWSVSWHRARGLHFRIPHIVIDGGPRSCAGSSTINCSPWMSSHDETDFSPVDLCLKYNRSENAEEMAASGSYVDYAGKTRIRSAAATAPAFWMLQPDGRITLKTTYSYVNFTGTYVPGPQPQIRLHIDPQPEVHYQMTIKPQEFTVPVSDASSCPDVSP